MPLPFEESKSAAPRVLAYLAVILGLVGLTWRALGRTGPQTRADCCGWPSVAAMWCRRAGSRGARSCRQGNV